MVFRVEVVPMRKPFRWKTLLLAVVCPGMLFVHAVWLFPRLWAEDDLEINAKGVHLEQLAYTSGMPGDEHTTLNLDEVDFVLSDELCFESYAGLPESERRKQWLETTLDDFQYDDVLYQQINRGNEPLPGRKNFSKGPRLRPASPTLPTGSSLVAAYRAACAFAVERLRSSPHMRRVAACSFPKFTRDESRQIWRQAVRRRALDAACAPLATVARSKWGAGRYLFWDLRSHLAYCAIFKVGSTSWMGRMLHWAGVRTGALSDEEVHTLMEKVFQRPPPQDIAAELLSHEPLLFMVHRHPFVRIVSAYTNKIEVGYRPYSRMEWLAAVRGKSLYEIMQGVKRELKSKFPWLSKSHALDQLLSVRGDPQTSPDFKAVGDRNDTSLEMTFQEFVRVVIAQILPCFDDAGCLSFIDEHWQPQHSLCSPCNEYYDVLAAMHTFSQDTDLVTTLVGRRDPPHRPATPPRPACAHNCSSTAAPRAATPKRRRNVSLGGSYIEKTFEYLKQLSSEEKRLLYVANYLDFTLFGYTPDAIERAQENEVRT